MWVDVTDVLVEALDADAVLYGEGVIHIPVEAIVLFDLFNLYLR